MSQSRVLQPFDPSVDGQQFDPTINNTGGALIFFNFSVFEGQVTFPDGSKKIVPAWHWRCVHWEGGQNGSAIWNVLVIPNTANAPSQTMLIEAYLGLADLPPEDMGSLPRQANVGNQVGVTSGTSLKQDGDAPATSLIEATPSDQAQSSWAMNNDASGFIKVLSAGVLRAILNVVRGDAGTTKAVVTLGDAGDPSILTVHGTADKAGSLNGAFNANDDSVNHFDTLITQTPAASARGVNVGVWDGAAQHFVNLFDGSGNFIASVPTSQIAAGALPAGVTIPAGQVTAGTLPTGVKNTKIDSDTSGITSDGSSNLTVTGITGLILRNNNGAGMHLMRIFSGSGTGTFTTGASASPTSVQATCSQLNSTQTMGYDTPGLTVHINTGASLSWSAVAFA